MGNAGAGGTDWSACTARDSCVIVTMGPCGAGCEPIPLSRLIAINSANVAAYQKSMPPVPCVVGKCSLVPPDQVQAPNYYAQCISGECQALDVRATSLSACTSAADCYLRLGTGCCPCGTNDLVAVSSQAPVDQVLCAPAVGCAADCVSAPPSNASAACTAGHCLVDYATGAAGAE